MLIYHVLVGLNVKLSFILNVCRVLFALFVIHTFALSDYLSLCFLFVVKTI